MKKKWEKPKLVILYRGQSEENVLKICKHEHGATASEENVLKICKHEHGATAGPQVQVNACFRPNCASSCVSMLVT